MNQVIKQELKREVVKHLSYFRSVLSEFPACIVCRPVAYIVPPFIVHAFIVPPFIVHAFIVRKLSNAIGNSETQGIHHPLGINQSIKFYVPFENCIIVSFFFLHLLLFLVHPPRISILSTVELVRRGLTCSRNP